MIASIRKLLSGDRAEFDDIRDSPGLFDVAEILFGDDAERRLAEYFGGADAVPPAVAQRRSHPDPAT